MLVRWSLPCDAPLISVVSAANTIVVAWVKMIGAVLTSATIVVADRVHNVGGNVRHTVAVRDLAGRGGFLFTKIVE